MKAPPATTAVASYPAWLPWALVLLAGLILPVCVDGYALRTFTVFYIYLILAAGLTVIVNYAGLLNLGFIAFSGIGAYTYAVLNREFALPFFAALPLGALVAAGLGLLIGFPTLRVRGDYLALVTLGFGEIVRICLVNIWGPHGIPGIAPPVPAIAVGGSANLNLLFYAVAFGPAALALLLLQRLDRSRTASRWFALRDNETAAQACGINPVRDLLLALVIGSAIAGAAGVIFAGVQRYVSPASFVLDESILVLSIVVIAGGRSLWRLLLAAALLTFLPELLRGLADYRMLIFGSVLSAYVVIEEKWKRSSMGGGLPASDSEIEPALGIPQRKVPEFVRLADAEGALRLEIQDVTKLFDGVTALQGVGFAMEFNQSIIGLIGPNGAGKTTLFNCISGALPPTAGKILFSGLADTHSPHHAARAGLARTFQTPQLFESMSVRENIGMGSIASPQPLTDEQIDELVAYSGLSEVAHSEVRSQPLGTQRRIELARALALRPRLMLLDEIAAGLSSGEKQELAAMIRELARDAHISFLVVEHDMDFILPLAGEVVVLDAGRVLARGTPDQITQNSAVIEAYLGGNHAAA